jgi:hypothetical protein
MAKVKPKPLIQSLLEPTSRPGYSAINTKEHSILTFAEEAQ